LKKGHRQYVSNQKKLKNGFQNKVIFLMRSIIGRKSGIIQGGNEKKEAAIFVEHKGIY